TLIDVTATTHKHHFDSEDTRIQKANLKHRIEEAFNELNANDDDHITKDEFIDWYMRCGLLDEANSNVINVVDSEVFRMGKRSRKTKKKHHPELSSHSNVNSTTLNENSVMPSKKTRHHFHMIEHHEEKVNNDEQETNDQSINQINENNLSQNVNDDDDDASSSTSGNDRWQNLLHAVLDQLRSQRLEREQQDQQRENNSSFRNWKRIGEERMKNEYLRQKSSQKEEESQLHSHKHKSKRKLTEDTQESTNGIKWPVIDNKQKPLSSDIITIRL
ncbi:unnamed protein product, partial [Didymodactylos carnosus]